MNIFFLFILILTSGCNLVESGKKGTEPEVEQYYRAELNGKAWSGNPRAAFTFTETDTILQFFATRYDTVNYPYNDHISFTVDYEPAKVIYDVTLKYENTWVFGGFYNESDGDATIATYEPIIDSANYLNIEIKDSETGQRTVTGTFTMIVVVNPDYDTEYNNQYRQQPDTVRITDGEFRVLLEERE